MLGAGHTGTFARHASKPQSPRNKADVSHKSHCLYSLGSSEPPLTDKNLWKPSLNPSLIQGSTLQGCSEANSIRTDVNLFCIPPIKYPFWSKRSKQSKMALKLQKGKAVSFQKNLNSNQHTSYLGQHWRFYHCCASPGLRGAMCNPVLVKLIGNTVK